MIFCNTVIVSSLLSLPSLRIITSNNTTHNICIDFLVIRSQLTTPYFFQIDCYIFFTENVSIHHSNAAITTILIICIVSVGTVDALKGAVVFKYCKE